MRHATNSILLLALTCALGLASSALASPRGQLQIVAHEDDDLYFMTPAVPAEIQAGEPSATIFLTAGDAGRPASYWQGREAGIRAAYAQMAGVTNSWTFQPVTAAGRSLTAFRLNGVSEVVVVFLRLPDGSPGGGGYPTTGFESLLHLWSDPEGTLIHSIDGAHQYTRSQLIETIAELIAQREPRVLRIQDMTNYHGSDHSDHVHSGRFAFEAHLRHPPAHRLRAYRAYNISDQPVNLSAAEIAESNAIITTYGAFDSGVSANSWNQREIPLSDLDEAHVGLALMGSPLGDVCLTAHDLGTTSEGVRLEACADDDRQSFRITERDIRHAGRCLVSPAPGGAPGTVGLAFCSDRESEGWTFFSDGHIRGSDGACLGSTGSLVTLEICTASSRQWEMTALPGAPAGVGGDFSLVEFGTDPSRYDSLEFGDVDGDGLADACARRADGIYCALALGGGAFDSAALWHPNFGDDDSWAPVQYGSTLQMGDIDGDGRADLCGRGIIGIYCVRSNGSAFFDFRLWTSVFSDSEGGNAFQTYGSLRLGDVNGDARADLCGHRAGSVQCLLSSGLTFGAATTWIDSSWVTALALPAAQLGQTMMLGDIDGDGADDLCERGSAGVHCALASPANASFVDLAMRSQAEYSDGLGWGSSEIYWGGLRLGDVTGDGQADLCGRGGAGILCLVSMDGRFNALNHLLSPDFSNTAGLGTIPTATSLQLADIDGDQRADVCAAGPTALTCTVFGDPLESAGPAINIDFGSFFGTPDDIYGAAARLSGPWNQAGLGSTQLLDARGEPTIVTVEVLAETDLGSTQSAAGGDELLLSDNFFSSAGAGWDVQLTNLAAGAYLVTLYAPSNGAVPTGDMTLAGIPIGGIPGATSGALTRTGSWTHLAVTHSGGSLTISGDGPGYTGLAGLQLVPVPEAGSGVMIVFGATGLWLLGRRRTRSSS